MSGDCATYLSMATEETASVIEAVMSNADAKSIGNILLRDGVLAKLQLYSVQETTSTAATTSPDYIFLEEDACDCDIYELCKELKSCLSKTKILLITSHDNEEFLDKLLDSGADEFLFKPFSDSELLDRIFLQATKHDASQNRDIRGGDSGSFPYIGDHINNYTVTKIIGMGTFSVLYKVVDNNSQDEFVLKMLSRIALDYPHEMEKFDREISLFSQLKHSNIVEFHDIGMYGDLPYFVMDYVDGINLEVFLTSRGFPDLSTIFSVSQQTASALESVHNLGIIHRDIKLSNILMSIKNGKIFLADFGISHFIAQCIDLSGFIEGTPIYMAPELFKGESSSIKSDIYSFGVTMYHFITATPPFTAKDDYEMSMKHIEEMPKLIRLIRPDIPQELENLIVDKCMAKNPLDRPESFKEIIDSLNIIEGVWRKASLFASTPKSTILLVDDEESILNSLNRVLKKGPYEILFASNGEEALKKMQEHRVQLLMTDYSMPVMDGLELVKQVHDLFPDTMRIILSGASDVKTLVSAINSGHIYKFITKPFNNEDIRLTVQRALEQYELEANNKRLLSIIDSQNSELRKVKATS